MKKLVLISLLNLLFAAGFAQTSWTPYAGNPVVPNTMDPKCNSMYGPVVMQDGAVYRMWYTRKYGLNSSKEAIAYATSPDGISWNLIDSMALMPTTSTANRFDSKKAGHPCIIKDNGVYKMWYWGEGPNIGNVGYATSTDARNWTKVNGAGTDQSVFDRTMDGSGALAIATPYVIKDGAVYRMWYSKVAFGATGLQYTMGYATSPDGLTWTKVPGSGIGGAIMPLGTTGTFDEISTVFPNVIKNGSTYQMWYSGVDAGTASRIGYATSTDGVNWTKIAGTAGKNAVLDGQASSIMTSGTGYKMWYTPINARTFSYATSGQVSGIFDTVLPSSLFLRQNFPNPFREQTSIAYSVLKPGYVSLKIYDVQGREVKTLAAAKQTAGEYHQKLDGHNLPAGIYYYKLQVDNEGETSGKMIKLK